MPRRAPHEHVEHGSEQQPEGGDADHPGEHRDAERVPHLGSGAGGQSERHDAHDEGHGGHEDRAQPQVRSEEHTSELQSRSDLVCRLLLEKKKKKQTNIVNMQAHIRTLRISLTSLEMYAPISGATTMIDAQDRPSEFPSNELDALLRSDTV